MKKLILIIALLTCYTPAPAHAQMACGDFGQMPCPPAPPQPFQCRPVYISGQGWLEVCQ